MRTELGRFNGQRLRFEGVVDRFGSKKSFKGWPEKTILLTHVKLVNGSYYVTDHLWFTVRLTLDALNLQPGDTVRFNARVNTYMKGHRDDRQMDYKLTHPTNFATSQVSQHSNQIDLFSTSLTQT